MSNMELVFKVNPQGEYQNLDRLEYGSVYEAPVQVLQDLPYINEAEYMPESRTETTPEAEIGTFVVGQADELHSSVKSWAEKREELIGTQGSELDQELGKMHRVANIMKEEVTATRKRWQEQRVLHQTVVGLVEDLDETRRMVDGLRADVAERYHEGNDQETDVTLTRLTTILRDTEDTAGILANRRFKEAELKFELDDINNQVRTARASEKSSSLELAVHRNAYKALVVQYGPAAEQCFKDAVNNGEDVQHLLDRMPTPDELVDYFIGTGTYDNALKQNYDQTMQLLESAEQTQTANKNKYDELKAIEDELEDKLADVDIHIRQHNQHLSDCLAQIRELGVVFEAYQAEEETSFKELQQQAKITHSEIYSLISAGVRIFASLQPEQTGSQEQPLTNEQKT